MLTNLQKLVEIQAEIFVNDHCWCFWKWYLIMKNKRFVGVANHYQLYKLETIETPL